MATNFSFFAVLRSLVNRPSRKNSHEWDAQIKLLEPYRAAIIEAMTTDTLQARWLHWKKLPFPPEADITVKLHSDEEEEVAVKELVTAMSDNIEVCLRDPSADTGYKVELEWDIERLNACSAQLPLATKQYTQELNAIARAIV